MITQIRRITRPSSNKYLPLIIPVPQNVMVKNLILIQFNRDLSRGCLVYMFSLRFSGSKFLINLRWKFRVHKIFFVYVKFFGHKISRDLQSFHFVFKITISKIRDLCCRLLFH